MNEIEYERMFRAEDRYWWYVSRRELVVDTIARLGLPPDAELVDVGCGTGATAEALGRFGRVTGVDCSPTALEFCRRRGLGRLHLGDARRLLLPDASCDAIVATDVLEHLDDDVAALREFARALRPGGFVVATVPAYQFLWSEHDEALMHRRRYVAGVLAARAGEAGLEVVRIGYALSFLFPLALGRLLRRRRGPSASPEADVPAVPGWLNRALVRFQRLEARLMRHVRLPFGLSVVAVLRRPAGAAPRRASAA